MQLTVIFYLTNKDNQTSTDMKPDQAKNVNEKISKEDNEKCVHCQQLYIKRWMNRHTKSGKCEKYAPFIEFTTTWLHCKLCLKSKTDRPNVHVLYKHLENKHKSEMFTKETLYFYFEIECIRLYLNFVWVSKMGGFLLQLIITA